MRTIAALPAARPHSANSATRHDVMARCASASEPIRNSIVNGSVKVSLLT